MPSRIAVSMGFSSLGFSFFDLLEDTMADSIFSVTSEDSVDEACDYWADSVSEFSDDFPLSAFSISIIVSGSESASDSASVNFSFSFSMMAVSFSVSAVSVFAELLTVFFGLLVSA